MAATVAPSQHIPPGLHPLQAAALRAAQAQRAQQQQPQQQRSVDSEPFDLTSKKLSLSDFCKVRTLGTGMHSDVSVWCSG